MRRTALVLTVGFVATIALSGCNWPPGVTVTETATAQASRTPTPSASPSPTALVVWRVDPDASEAETTVIVAVD